MNELEYAVLEKFVFDWERARKLFHAGSKDFLKVQKNSIVQENEPKVTVGKFIVLSSLTIQGYFS